MPCNKKQIAILSSHDSHCLNTIVEYFKDKYVEITCISDKEDAKILKEAQKLNIKSIYVPFEENTEFFIHNRFDIGILDGYEKPISASTLCHCQFINIHPSLLPAFCGNNPIESAYKAGVKVSGVTIHYVAEEAHNERIIAQYPVFIDYLTTLKEFEEEIYKVEEKLVPFVIESILNNVVFSFDMLLKPSSCAENGGCNGCGGCNKQF